MRSFMSSVIIVAACIGSAAAQQTTSPEPGPNDATVYFVRPAKMGFAINFWAFVDETAVGATKGNQHVRAIVPAGEHVLWSRSGNVSSLKMTLEAGRTYYIEQEVRMGGLRARVNLEVLGDADGEAAVDKTKPAPARDAEDERGGELVASEYAEAVENARTP